MDVDVTQGPGYGEARIWNEKLAPDNGAQSVHLVRAIDLARFLTRFAQQASQ
jgi:hypothetical protein